MGFYVNSSPHIYISTILTENLKFWSWNDMHTKCFETQWIISKLEIRVQNDDLKHLFSSLQGRKVLFVSGQFSWGYQNHRNIFNLTCFSIFAQPNKTMKWNRTYSSCTRFSKEVNTAVSFELLELLYCIQR